jgi:hypothetical protein
MWDTISKPPQYVGSKIDDFFEIQYAALPHYEEKYDDFVADSIVLRRRCGRAAGRLGMRASCARLLARMYHLAMLGRHPNPKLCLRVCLPSFQRFSPPEDGEELGGWWCPILHKGRENFDHMVRCSCGPMCPASLHITPLHVHIICVPVMCTPSHHNPQATASCGATPTSCRPAPCR